MRGFQNNMKSFELFYQLKKKETPILPIRRSATRCVLKAA